MIAVSNSSPLIILAKLDCFELLNRLFSRLIISPEVYGEVVVFGKGLAGSLELASAEWAEKRQLQDPGAMAQAHGLYPLGVGELSAILLAKECRADAVLLDDHQARQLAKREGLLVIGSVGLLEAFHARGLLPDLPGAFRKLLSEHVYIDKRLLDLRLKLLGLPPL